MDDPYYFPQAKPTPKRNPPIWLIGIIVFIGPIILHCILHSSDSPPTRRNPMIFDKDRACFELQEHVTSALKAPATAQFPAWNLWRQSTEGGAITLEAYVDSENSFGALLRLKFRGYFKQNDEGRWYLYDVQEIK
ncbi:MAG: hypothetical protein IJC16_00120 [Rikenellaceae bacterium]|nr:hypothetical protein [Rikenellaceae bacterium]